MNNFLRNYIKTCSWIFIMILSGSLVLSSGCSGSRIQRQVFPPESINSKNTAEDKQYLKLHMNDGELYILSDWRVNKPENLVTGTGSHLDMNRDTLNTGTYNISCSEIVLAESNEIKGSVATPLLAALTIVTGAFAIYCMTNPKACFGSCPTFYAYNGNDYIVQAEGFSSSILPCLETGDVDALYRMQPTSDLLDIKLKNEAYETHVIKSADILALRKPEGGRVYSTPGGDFYQGINLMEPSEANGPEGDCSQKICSFDGEERYSAADSFDLAERETIELTFNNVPDGDLGLVIASRQTLMTTFLIYQTLAYMGTQAVDLFAKLERSSKGFNTHMANWRSVLGSIDVLVVNSNGEWEKVSEFGETGPIATDVKLVPLNKTDSQNSAYKIRLRMAKGLWRIDYAALAELGNKVEPFIIKPSGSFPQTAFSSSVVELLNNPDSALITLPGDEYFLSYKLPADYNNYEYFMNSRGYYLEWMRNEWLAEENPAKFYQMLFSPGQYYKDLAPQFKKIEADMEKTFWSSKYVNL